VLYPAELRVRGTAFAFYPALPELAPLLLAALFVQVGFS